MKNENSIVMEENQDIVAYKFFKVNNSKVFLYYLGGLLTFGIMFLIFYWFENLELWFYDEVTDYTDSSHACLMKENTFQIIKLQTLKVKSFPKKPKKFEIYFEYNHTFYTFNEFQQKFINIEKRYHSELIQDFQKEEIKCLNTQEAEDLQKFYQENRIRIKKENLFKTIIKKFFKPLNIYEVVLLLIDVYNEFYEFALLLAFYITVQVILDVWNQREKADKINSLSNIEEIVTVIREINGTTTNLKISSRNIVIGDIILMTPKQQLTCDILLIQGSCLIDQAVLTGESMPITKNEVQEGKQPKENNYVYAGSDCLMLRQKEVKGLVVHTAWNTLKGNLVGKLLQTKFKEFKFEKDVRIYVTFLFILYTILSVFVFYLDYSQDIFNINKILVRFTEIITCAIPPSLFFAFAVASRVIQSRLTKKNIFCLLPEKIKESGRIKKICFDKTGTLTSNSIHIFGFTVCENKIFENSTNDLKELTSFNYNKQLMEILSCCNTLNLLKGKIIGDPIEEEMFKISGYKINDTRNVSVYFGGDQNFYEIVPNKHYKKLFKQNPNFVYRIVKTFEFNSIKKKMSTVIMNDSENSQQKFTVLVKGAPEQIVDCCDQNTIPENYYNVLQEYSQQGFRILALAFKHVDTMPKDETESDKDLTFIGFLLLNNPIKPQTLPVLNHLKSTGVQCSMITGDNIYTAINVGVKTNLIEENENIWVGTYNKKKKYINWSYYNNQEIFKHLSKKINKKIINDASSIQSIENSDILKSIIKVEDMSQIGFQRIYNVCESLEKSNTILALDGDSFDKLVENFYDNEKIMNILLKYTKIYGRTKPKQKQKIIKLLREQLEKDNYCIGFVGDGSNDCQALHSSNLGLSIGNNESSIASSFSTSEDNISPIIEILEEGKFLLENSIQMFQLTTYMGIMESTCILILTYYHQGFNVWHYTFGIFFWVPNFLLMSISQPSQLNHFYPKAGLLNRKMIQTIIYTTLFMLAFLFLFFNYIFGRIETKSSLDIDPGFNQVGAEQKAFIEPMFVFLYHSTNNIFMAFAFNRGTQCGDYIYCSIDKNSRF